METSLQHHTISLFSQQDEQSTRVYGTAIPRMVETQSAESRNKCHFQAQSFLQHQHSLHYLCPTRMRHLFLYSSIANFQSPCPNLLISVDKRPGGLQSILWWQKTEKKYSFLHKLILRQSPSILKTKQFCPSTSQCCRETIITKVYLHSILDACNLITGKIISVKETDPVADTNEPRH